MSSDPAVIDQALENARRALLEARNANGWWEGELSSSALSTATAVFALRTALDAARETKAEPLDSATTQSCEQWIARGIEWLASHQNADGGWGDTVRSFSNISTTALCWAAIAGIDRSSDPRLAEVQTRAEGWLVQQAGGIDPARLSAAIIARYGKDKTFSVPILTMCALAGRLGSGREAWNSVPQLPFELAAFPQRGFKWLRLPVVSYALPALIAIGLVRHRRGTHRNPLSRAVRWMARRRALKLLARIQPESGGFLEATPLTSFVLMSLAGAGQMKHPAVAKAIDFLIRSAPPDGSWPIDTNLATWVTTLTINALATSPSFDRDLPAEQRRPILEWLLRQQYRSEHPYTLADPGAWAWTDLTGGVPDADDTPGALLALHHLASREPRARNAAIAGVRWLMEIQNRDGGIPTFCRGWGKLPFDRSSADLTAHTLRAWSVWADAMPAPMRERLASRAIPDAVSFLCNTQRADGEWVPLWFGNQHVQNDENPTYGTTRVLRAAAGLWQAGAGAARWGTLLSAAVGRGVRWLLSAQNEDGGWGGAAEAPSSIEETALAVEALALLRLHFERVAKHVAIGEGRAAGRGTAEVYDAAILAGVDWLLRETDDGRRFEPTPIGFYFAKLWYFEKLYPLIFTVSALTAVTVIRAAGRGSGSLSPVLRGEGQGEGRNVEKD